MTQWFFMLLRYFLLCPHFDFWFYHLEYSLSIFQLICIMVYWSCWSFQRTNSVSWILCIVLFVPIIFISIFSLIIPYYLLLLYMFVSLYSRVFRCVVKLCCAREMLVIPQNTFRSKSDTTQSRIFNLWELVRATPMN